MSMQVRPGRVVDRATSEEAAYAAGVAAGRAQALAEVHRPVKVAFALLAPRTDKDGQEVIDGTRRILSEIEGWERL